MNANFHFPAPNVLSLKVFINMIGGGGDTKSKKHFFVVTQMDFKILFPKTKKFVAIPSILFFPRNIDAIFFHTLAAPAGHASAFAAPTICLPDALKRPNSCAHDEVSLPSGHMSDPFWSSLYTPEMGWTYVSMGVADQPLNGWFDKLPNWKIPDSFPPTYFYTV